MLIASLLLGNAYSFDQIVHDNLRLLIDENLSFSNSGYNIFLKFKLEQKFNCSEQIGAALRRKGDDILNHHIFGVALEDLVSSHD